MLQLKLSTGSLWFPVVAHPDSVQTGTADVIPEFPKVHWPVFHIASAETFAFKIILGVKRFDESIDSTVQNFLAKLIAKTHY